MSLAKRTLTTALAVLLAVGCGGARVQFTLRDPSGKVRHAPANGARLEAARHELSELVGHPVDVQIDTGLLSNDLAGLTERYARTVETIVGCLRGLQRERPDAFARVGTKLDAVHLRYDATLDRSEGKLDGSTLTVRTPASLNEVRVAMFEALLGSYERTDGNDLFTMDPRQVPTSRHEAYFDAIVHYSRYEPKAATRAEFPSWDPEGDVVTSDRRGRSLQKVLALYPLLAAGKLRDEATRHIVSEGEYYVLSMWRERTRAQSSRAPDDSVVRRTQRAYVEFLQRDLAKLPEKEQKRVARALFSHDEAASRAAFAGFDRLGWALPLAQAAAARAEPVALDTLEDEVVCPHREDPEGKLTRNASCNAGFHRAALSDEESRKRLARFLLGADPRATRDFFVNLRWVRDPTALDLFRDLESNVRVRNAAGRVLGEVIAHDGGLSEPIRKEGYALYQRRSDARGLALYMILSTDPHRGFESVQAGVSPAIGPAEIRAMLDVGPRALDFLASGWQTLVFPKASLVSPYLGSALKSRTLLDLATAACKEGKRSELQTLRTGMENAARASQLDRSRYDGALEVVRPEACPPPKR